MVYYCCWLDLPYPGHFCPSYFNIGKRLSQARPGQARRARPGQRQVRDLLSIVFLIIATTHPRCSTADVDVLGEWRSYYATSNIWAHMYLHVYLCSCDTYRNTRRWYVWYSARYRTYVAHMYSGTHTLTFMNVPVPVHY